MYFVYFNCTWAPNCLNINCFPNSVQWSIDMNSLENQHSRRNSQKIWQNTSPFHTCPQHNCLKHIRALWSIIQQFVQIKTPVATPSANVTEYFKSTPPLINTGGQIVSLHILVEYYITVCSNQHSRRNPQQISQNTWTSFLLLSPTSCTDHRNNCKGLFFKWRWESRDNPSNKFIW